MPPVIIADASCLILLEKISALHLLHTWIAVRAVQDARQMQVLSLTLDTGEASAIALALEHPERLLIIDERRGRNIAHQLGLAITGTLGVLLEAKKAVITPFLDAIEATNFRLSAALVQIVLRQVRNKEPCALVATLATRPSASWDYKTTTI